MPDELSASNSVQSKISFIVEHSEGNLYRDSGANPKRNMGDRLGFFFLLGPPPVPKKLMSGGGGGGGGGGELWHFFPRLNIFLLNFPDTEYITNLSDKQKRVHNVREHVKRFSFQLIIIQPKKSGGTFDIMSPTFKIVGEGLSGTFLSPCSPPPPSICAHV